MFRKILFTGVTVCAIVALTGCNKDEKKADPVQPLGTVLFSEGFEGDLSKWEGQYMVSAFETYSWMSVTTAAYKTGTHSLTTDSNMTALYHVELNREESGTVGVEFYMKAQSLGQANFGVAIGQNPGSSGAVSPAFGIFFDPSDSIKCTAYNSFPLVNAQTMIAPIQADHWYKCKVEVNMTNSTVSYFIDDAVVHTEKSLDTSATGSGIQLYGIDRLLVLRGKYGNNYSPSSDGAKPYYVDDITLYKK